MPYRFAICDDDADYAAYMENLAARWTRQAGTCLETECFPSSEAFLFHYEERRPLVAPAGAKSLRSFWTDRMEAGSIAGPHSLCAAGYYRLFS